MQSTAEAKIAAAADQVDRLRAAFPEMNGVVFRMKATEILRIMGVDADIAVIAVREALDVTLCALCRRADAMRGDDLCPDCDEEIRFDKVRDLR